jgi:hypothetical protein
MRKPKPPLRDQTEIQRAHDLLAGILLGDCPEMVPKCDTEMIILNSVASCLCWVLQHEYNPNVSNLLATLEAEAKAHGWEIRPGGPRL